MASSYIFRLSIAICCVFFVFTAEIGAQTGPSAPHLPALTPKKGLFDTDDILHITMSGNMRPLLNNRIGDAKNHALIFSYIQDSSTLTIPVEVKTRGHFRRIKGNCKYPPLQIKFPKDSAHFSSIFKEQKKTKLVMPCDNDDAYLVREWLVYKLYNLITPKSFRARLVKVTLKDDKNSKTSTPFYGILLEEEAQMAKRNQLVSVERKMKPKQVQKEAFLSMAVFEYLIGNTDWSIQYMQNIKLLASDSTAVPVAIPYDFDHAGIVDAPYAQPAEELQMRSTHERRYRGYCVSELKNFEPVIAQYNQVKNDIYGLYTGCKLLDAQYIKSTVQYLDAFYATINNPKAWQKEFTYPCDPTGTGNVVIKGLKKD